MAIWARTLLITAVPEEAAPWAEAHLRHLRELQAAGRLRAAGSFTRGDGYLELFEAADLGVGRSSSVDYRGTIDDPRVSEVRILRPLLAGRELLQRRRQDAELHVLGLEFDRHIILTQYLISMCFRVSALLRIASQMTAQR